MKADIPSDEYAPTERVTYDADLSLNVNPFGCSPVVYERLKRGEYTVSQYAPPDKQLIYAIAALHDVDPDSVILTDGCDGALRLITMSLLEAGEMVTIPVPTWHRYAYHVAAAGAESRFVPYSRMHASLSEPCAMAIVCNPNNPLGSLIGNDEIARLARETPGTLVVDEALGHPDTSAARLVKDHDNLIVVRSFSKLYGLAGMRIGYALVPQKSRAAVKAVTSPFQTSILSQEAALAAIEDPSFLTRSIDFIAAERERLCRSLSEMGLTPSASESMNLLVDTSTTGLSSQEVASALLRDSVKVTPGDIFRADCDSSIRISLASEQENALFVDAMKRLIEQGTKDSERS